jgi:pyrimidine oxygenase
MLYMVIADETDEAAFAKWDSYVAGADQEALAHLFGKAAEDKTAGADSTAAAMTRAANPVNFNMGTLVGSYAHVARMLDEVASMPGVKGIMLTFDDFLTGLDAFGDRIQPLMACRKDRVAAAA